jgi:hypothetical protein
MYGRKILIAAIALMPMLAACGSSSNPNNPTPTEVTETFTGTITQNGAATITYDTATAGTVTATLTALAPDATSVIGFALGTWDGSACQLVIVDPAGTTGSVHGANVSTKGTYCVHLYDVGKITADQAVTYTVTVEHP